MGLHEAMLGCRICAAADGDALDCVSPEENDTHERDHVPPSTAHYLRSTGRVVRLSPGNRWVEREAYVNHTEVRVEPSGHLTSCEPDQYDSDCPACRSSLTQTFDVAVSDGTDEAEVNGKTMTVEEFVSWLIGDEPEDASAPDDCECEDCKADEDAFKPWPDPDGVVFGEPEPLTSGDVDAEEAIWATYRSDRERITDEAYRLVMGDRQSDYNHPADDFKATGRQWGAILTNWLHSEGYVLHCCANTGEGHEADVPDVEPRIVALMMAQLKLSRESHKPKRDNRTDAIGYVLCADRIVEDY